MQQPQCIFHVFPISCSPILSYDVWHFWENFDHYFSILMVNEHIPESKIEQPNFSKARKCQVSEMLRTELDSTSVDTGKEFDQKKCLFTRKTDKVQWKTLLTTNQEKAKQTKNTCKRWGSRSMEIAWHFKGKEIQYTRNTNSEQTSGTTYFKIRRQKYDEKLWDKKLRASWINCHLHTRVMSKP